MFILRPSSPLRFIEPHQPVRDAPLPQDILAAEGAEPFIDEGLPLPEAYEVDILRALLQDPFRVFIYWEVREESLRSLTRYFSREDARGFRTTLRLTDIEGGQEAYFYVDRRGRYWMHVFPDREYEFEIGVRSDKHGYIALLRSNPVRTPRGSISPLSDDDEEYRLSAPGFIEILEMSGFAAEQALDITVSAMPGAAGDDGRFSEAMLKLPKAVRDAIIAAGAGESLSADLIAELPDFIKDEINALLRHDGRLASVGLMHYLPELLREALDSGDDLIGDPAHPLHIAPRYLVGASESAAWPGAEAPSPGMPRPSGPDSKQRRPGARSGAGRLRATVDAR